MQGSDEEGIDLSTGTPGVRGFLEVAMAFGPQGEKGPTGPPGPQGRSAESSTASLPSDCIAVKAGTSVKLRGVVAVAGGSPGDTLMTLPAEFRPQPPGGTAPWRWMALAVKAGAAHLIPVTINPGTGAVSWLGLSPSFTLHLDGITFSCQ